MRQNNISAQKKNITHSAVAHSPACGKWTQTRRIFFLDTFNPGLQRVFEPFLRVFKVFPHSKGFKAFQGSRNWLKYSEKQIGFILVVGIRALAFNIFARETVAFCTKQEIVSISITWNRGKSVDIHTYKLTYPRISEIKLVLTQETQAGHVLDQNQSLVTSQQ